MVLDAESPVRESETREGLRRAIDRVHGEKREAFDPMDSRKDTGYKYVYSTMIIIVCQMINGWHFVAKDNEGSRGSHEGDTGGSTDMVL